MLQNVSFRRKFSCRNYKNKRMLLAEMTFTDLPLTTERGDLYPITCAEGMFTEQTANGTYNLLPRDGVCCVQRLLGGFFPYATYDLSVDILPRESRAGFAILWQDKILKVYGERQDDRVTYFYQYGDQLTLLGACDYEAGMHLLFTFHGGVYIETYAEYRNRICHVGNAKNEEWDCLIEEDVFFSASAHLFLETAELLSIHSVEQYLDCGIMQADIKPVKYENGEVLVENGNIFFTYTSRFEEQMMQQVASYRLSTGELKLEGALLFDCGDGRWCGDVATTLIYDRGAQLWRLWTCVFSHGHVLAYGESKQDLRFGINVVDVTKAPQAMKEQEFGACIHDEDPDLYFDRESGYWYLAVCRKDTEVNKYRYYLFRSRYPDRDFSFVSYTYESLETTGGSFVRMGTETYFVCGRSFSERAKYDVLGFPTLKKLGELSCDYPDGGFRGWGSVIEIPCGTRRRLLWATFDRTRGSDFNWSYGNLYFFESETYSIKK